MLHGLYISCPVLIHVQLFSRVKRSKQKTFLLNFEILQRYPAFVTVRFEVEHLVHTLSEIGQIERLRLIERMAVFYQFKKRSVYDNEKIRRKD